MDQKITKDRTMKDKKIIFPVELGQHGQPNEVAKQDHRRALLPHPTQSTGYWCDAGDTLEIVCRYTGFEPSVAPELWILPVAEPHDSESKPRQVVQLKFGNQLVTASSRGVVYFTSLNFPTNADIDVQIISGARPMPRFVLGKNTPQDWEQTLIDYPDAAYGELVGRRMIVTMPLPVLKKEIDDPSKVTELWDIIVTHAEDCYGLHSSNFRPHKSTPFQYIFETKPDSSPGYMSASNYWLGTNISGACYVCNRNSLATDGWGPWHELGHHYQLEDMNWNGMGEVTVNLVSLYIQREFDGRASRLDSIWPQAFEYFKNAKKDFQKIGDLFIQVAMFWQLDVTFGKDFYARLGHRYRTLPDADRPKTSAQKMQLFILETSRVTSHDLSPFFLMWGITPTAETIKKLDQLTLYSLNKPIWENTDASHPYTYSLNQQNLSGRVVLPRHIHEGGLFDATVEVNRNTRNLRFQWNLPHGFRILAGEGQNRITLIAPEDIIHHSSAMISVTVTEPRLIGSAIGTHAMQFASKIRLKVTGEKDVNPDQYVDKYVMKKHGVDKLMTWNITGHGTVGNIYRDVWMDNSPRYFKLKKVPYRKYPFSNIDNEYWQFLGKYGPHEQYYLDEPVFDNVIATRKDRVVGAAGHPMSDSTFMGRVGAETTDGSEITLSSKPADCIHPGHYGITLLSGQDKKYKKTIIYDVLGDVSPPLKRGATLWGIDSSETWCGTHFDENIQM